MKPMYVIMFKNPKKLCEKCDTDKNKYLEIYETYQNKTTFNKFPQELMIPFSGRQG